MWGGYLLKNINTRGKKIGIDINSAAREIAEENGIVCFDDIRKVEDDSVDILISNHALEHVDDPIIYVKEFRRVVRNRGKIVLVVPHEISDELNPCDVNMELYTWSPQNLYNLLTTCKIDTISCERLSHAWLLNDAKILESAGWEEFHRISKLRAERDNIYQTIAVGIVLKDKNKDEDKFIRSREGIYLKYYNKMADKWEKAKEIISKHKRVAIYGAGTIGERICKFLLQNNCKVDCFVVSNAEENEKCINGIQVIPVNELVEKEKYLFILGVLNPNAKKSITEWLNNNRCSEILDFDTSIIDCQERGNR